jgi:peptide/nickel transport system permease protein
MVFSVLVLAATGPYLAPYDPLVHNYEVPAQAPSRAHPLGTDKFGRDQLSRILYAARIDVQIGIICTIIPFFVGVAIGLVSGYFGGRMDMILMRLVDFQVAFPFYVLLIIILAVLGPGVINMYYALILVGWVGFARLTRGETLVVKKAEYVFAARALGYNDFRIMTRHILPNAIAPALIFAMSDVTWCILAGAALGFLGLGVQPPTPEWGVMIAESREFLINAWWLPTFPGLAIAIVGLSFSLLGDGLSGLLRPSN